MTRPDTRRQKRGQADILAASQGATLVTLQSREFIEKLVREFHENNRQAQAAQHEAQRAFADAARFEQQAKDLDAKEQLNLAQIQQAQAELRQVQAKLQQAEAGRQQVLAELQEANTFADNARIYGALQMATHERFAGQATDARTVLDSFKITIPEETEPAGPALPAPPTSPMPVVPVDPTADDPRMDGPVQRFNEAHDEDEAESAGAV
jgi:chromosome segregation ATPase